MWDQKITQTALGNMIGMEQSSVGKRLRGERGWSIANLLATARALNTTVAYLVGEVDDPECTPSDLNREPTD
ncbi:helix-turn-helix transcriptional regulator [Leifsonia sp. ALI-44-B]|uniref:helix-turn-helix domain-containing protein n=1 Tax=Leifsonia sp. ALI-44-B TaxID=1933776 RepID=UPI00336AA693